MTKFKIHTLFNPGQNIIFQPLDSTPKMLLSNLQDNSGGQQILAHNVPFDKSSLHTEFDGTNNNDQMLRDVASFMHKAFKSVL